MMNIMARTFMYILEGDREMWCLGSELWSDIMLLVGVLREAIGVPPVFTIVVMSPTDCTDDGDRRILSVCTDSFLGVVASGKFNSKPESMSTSLQVNVVISVQFVCLD